jgi:Pyruvate/2-oxoacid:ferredoxin oxidoreductase delta subunit
VTKVKRQIIFIDEERCDGCGFCVPSCAEGALRIVNGKARLVKESYCDGLGACLGECPQGALSMLEMESDEYDEVEVLAHLGQIDPLLAQTHAAHSRSHMPSSIPLHAVGDLPVPGSPWGALACPSIRVSRWEEEEPAPALERQRSQLHQWPVQLHLLPAKAPFFENADLVLVADCVPFAYANFHEDFLRGHVIAVGCPKLDDARAYVDKVTQILLQSNIRSLKVAYMEVPCCRGLVQIAQQALANSGRQIPFESVMITVAG